MSMTSFVFPPLMHISLLNRKQTLMETHMEKSGELFSSSFEVERFGDEKEDHMRRIIVVDVVFLIFGIFACIGAHATVEVHTAYPYNKEILNHE